MTLYSYGFAKTAATTGTGYCTIRPASTLDCQVREIGVFNTTAVASAIGLVRNATSGTPSTSVLCQAQNPNSPASQTNIDTAWSGAATVASNYLRRCDLPATIGAGIIWTFGPNELWSKNGATTQLMLWNYSGSTSAALDIYIVVDE